MALCHLHQEYNTYLVQWAKCSAVKIILAPFESLVVLINSGNGVSATPLGYLFQCFAIHIAESFFLEPNLNLPSFSLKPLPHAPSQQSAEKLVLIFPTGMFKWSTEVTLKCCVQALGPVIP